jgi:outer membrane protein assembly factor BamB
LTLRNPLDRHGGSACRKRRALLAAAGTAAVGPSAGCLDDPTGGDSSVEWTHGPGGRVDSVSDGVVYVHEMWEGDAVGSGAGELYALERDGRERWTHDTGSVYERPRLADGTLYAGSDDGVVRAFDAEAGEVEWRYEVEPDESGGPPNPTVEAVGEAGYVAAGRLIALDPTTGHRRWQFGDEDSSVRSAAVHGDGVFVVDGHSVHLVERGDERWHTGSEFESAPRLTVDDGRPFVRVGTALLRLDPGDGTRRWTADVDHLGAWTVHEDRVYAAGTTLYAFDARDGTERWSEAVAEGLFDRVQVAADGGDHAVFVEPKDAAIHRATPDGEVTWSQSVPGNVWSFVAADLVYAGPSEGVYALEPA